MQILSKVEPVSVPILTGQDGTTQIPPDLIDVAAEKRLDQELLEDQYPNQRNKSMNQLNQQHMLHQSMGNNPNGNGNILLNAPENYNKPMKLFEMNHNNSIQIGNYNAPMEF